MWLWDDEDCDSVYVGDAFDPDGTLQVRGDLWLARAQIAKLRDHLNTLLGDAPAAKAETVAVEVGREYRLLPGAHRANREWGSAFEGEGVTRVCVVDGVDGDGDARVRSVDGTDPGDWAYVLPRYLAPLDDPTPSPDIAQAARAVAEDFMATYRLTYGSESARAHDLSTAFTKFADNLEGKSL